MSNETTPPPTLSERLRHEQSVNPDRDEYRHEVLCKSADALDRLSRKSNMTLHWTQ